MIQNVDSLHINKLLVLGRGVEAGGGAVYDSAVSGDSYDIAVAAGRYAALHLLTIDQVIFSGGYTFIHQATDTIPSGSEATAMHDVAISVMDDLDEKFDVVVEQESLTTYGNFLNIAQHVQEGDVLGIPIRSDHAKRALKVGRKVLPDIAMVAIPVGDDSRQYTKAGASISDLAATILYGVAMAPVKAGNHAAIRRNDQAVQKLVIKALRTKDALLTTVKQKFQPTV